MKTLAGVRLLLVGPLPPPLGLGPQGGMANQTRQLGELLAAQGMQVDTLAVNAPYRPGWLVHWRGVRALGRLLHYVVALWRASSRADLVHVMANSGWSWHLFAAPAIWVARVRRRPVVVNYRGGEAEEFLRRALPWVRLSLRRCARTVVPSGFLQQVFGRQGLEAVIVPNIIDLGRFHPGPERPHGQHLLVARNLEPLYDNATALRAFARLAPRWPNARLTIAGSGPELPALKNLAGALGVAAQVHFTGRLERDAMAALMREADVLINPSRADNMPNALLEALASGLAVVSTEVGGVPYMVRHDETALLVPVGDDAAMAAAVERLWLEPNLLSRLRAGGLALAAAHGWASIGPRWARVYAEALGGR